MRAQSQAADDSSSGRQHAVRILLVTSLWNRMVAMMVRSWAKSEVVSLAAVDDVLARQVSKELSVVADVSHHHHHWGQMHMLVLPVVNDDDYGDGVDEAVGCNNRRQENVHNDAVVVVGVAFVPRMVSHSRKVLEPV